MNTIFDTLSDLLDNSQNLLATSAKKIQPYAFGRTFPASRMTNQISILDKDGKEIGKRVEILIPGFKKDEIKLSLKDGSIILNAERKKEEQENRRPVQTNFLISEKIEFWIGVDERVDTASLSSSLENGILTIEMPFQKKKESESVRIEIK